jgi:signal transduction histidine kinase
MTLAAQDGEAPVHPEEHPEAKGVTLAITDEQVARLKELAQRVLREPFTRRPWMELAFFLVSGGLAVVGLGLIGVTMFTGIVLAITFFGLAVLGLSLRSARGMARWQRDLAHNLLGQVVEEPAPFAPRPGFFGWLQSVLRDRVAWRAVGYFALKVPWTFLGVYVAFSLWWDALACLLRPLFWGSNGGSAVWGFFPNVFSPGGNLNNGPIGFWSAVGIFLIGLVFLFAAPWVMRGFVTVDKLLQRTLLGPDPIAARVRSLEHARTQTVDASAATLRRIERDLHDGTQAQLVALAMRLGMAKEKLEDGEHVDLDRVRELVDEAHRGAKEAITELRDIARGIHPPALDIGLEGALATLASRSAVPTELHFDLHARPTPAIEAIAYYCVAELLANVAQHAHASRATVSCAQQGSWLRLVVRDDGRGGAQQSTSGSSSSGLTGLNERVHAVDGRLYLVSPIGGPTVVTVDLPLSV